MKLSRFFLGAIMLGAISMSVAACNVEGASPSSKTTEAQKAQRAADSIVYVENAEIDNIKRRLQQTADPGKIGFVVLLNEMGQPIVYTSVKGKITSSGKRLTPPVQKWEVDKGQYFGSEVHEAPSDEGTWGSSSPYIYFWTTTDRYYQWSGQYLYSDQPIRLDVTPLVLDIDLPTGK